MEQFSQIHKLFQEVPFLDAMGVFAVIAVWRIWQALKNRSWTFGISNKEEGLDIRIEVPKSSDKKKIDEQNLILLSDKKSGEAKKATRKNRIEK